MDNNMKKLLLFLAVVHNPNTIIIQDKCTNLSVSVDSAGEQTLIIIMNDEFFFLKNVSLSCPGIPDALPVDVFDWNAAIPNNRITWCRIYLRGKKVEHAKFEWRKL
jgi:hypothetical protein